MLICIKPTSSILVVLGSVFFLSACGGKSNKDEVIIALEENLYESNNAINRSTVTTLKELTDKSYDPSYTEERITLWLKKAEKISEISQNLYEFIGSAKRKMNTDFSASTLHQKLIGYKKDILNIDSSFAEHIEKVFKFIDSFSVSYYSNELSSKLSLLQNDIKLSENKIIAFCNTRVGITGDWFTSYEGIVGQSSTYVKSGEEVIITAGVSTYIRGILAVIKINGKDIVPGIEGYAEYKLKASKTPGTYSVPVQIEFTDPIIRKQKVKKVNIQYTVSKKCN